MARSFTQPERHRATATPSIATIPNPFIPVTTLYPRTRILRNFLQCFTKRITDDDLRSTVCIWDDTVLHGITSFEIPFYSNSRSLSIEQTNFFSTCTHRIPPKGTGWLIGCSSIARCPRSYLRLIKKAIRKPGWLQTVAYETGFVLHTFTT